MPRRAPCCWVILKSSLSSLCTHHLSHSIFHHHNVHLPYCLYSFDSHELTLQSHLLFEVPYLQWRLRSPPHRSPPRPRLPLLRMPATKVYFALLRHNATSRMIALWKQWSRRIWLTTEYRYDQGCHHQRELLLLSHCVFSYGRMTMPPPITNNAVLFCQRNTSY